MHLPKCFVLVLLIALCSLPSQCKVKKLKAVAKLIKAKMILKPLLKTGIIKLPMVHFVIPVPRPGEMGNGIGNLGNLFGQGNQQKKGSSNGDNGNGNGNGGMKCQSQSLFQGLRIPGFGNQKGGGGIIGSAGSLGSGFPMLNFGVLPRLNLGGLFGGSNNDCPPQSTPPTKECKDYPSESDRMRSPPANPSQEAASWRPIYSPMTSQMVDMSMADFGNLSMEELMNMANVPQQPHYRASYPHLPPPPVRHQSYQGSQKGGNVRLMQWNADQAGQTVPSSAMHHSPQQVHQEQIEQTQYDEEDDNSSQEKQKTSSHGNAEPVQQTHMSY